MPRASPYWHETAAAEFAEEMHAAGKPTAIEHRGECVGTSFAVPGTDFTVHFMDADFSKTLPENHFLCHKQDRLPSIVVTETSNRFKQRAVFLYSGARWRLSVPQHIDDFLEFAKLVHAAYHAMRKHAPKAGG